MPSTVIDKNGEIRQIDVLDILPPQEGEINITYGRIGTGKTSIGTKRVLEHLKKGHVEYVNWKIKWEGYDERKIKWKVLLYLLGFKKYLVNFPKENLKYFPINQSFIDELSKKTSCCVHLDEGHIPFDSYEATRMNVEKRSAVFATRHFDRSMYVYTQRANSVHVNLRGNSNRFYKCEKTIDFTIPIIKKRIIRFLVTEFQDLTPTGAIDETRKINEKGEEGNYKFAVSQKRYWGRKKIFEKYDSKYLRGNMPESQEKLMTAYKMSIKDTIKLLFKKNG